MQNTPLGIDKLSFWLGFLAATILCLLVYRFRKYGAQLIEYISEKTEALRKQRTAGIETLLRQEILRRAQSIHTAARLFPLDEILVEPHLLAPPPQRSSSEEFHPRLLFSQIVPHLPNAPEFSAQVGAVRLTIPQALQSVGRIALVGAPGSGKSTALAYLASLVALNKPVVTFLKNPFPVYIHIHDVRLTTGSNTDPVSEIVEALQSHVPPAAASKIEPFIRHAFETGDVFLILDGLDELSSPELEKALPLLSKLFNKYPSLKMITAAAPSANRSLVELGVEPVAISGWTRQEIREFVHKWTERWNATISSWVTKQTTPTPVVEPLLLSSWLTNDPAFYTPAEWTLKIWEACAGTLGSPNIVDVLKAHINRRLDPAAAKAVGVMAEDMLTKRSATIPHTAAEKLLESSLAATRGDGSAHQGIASAKLPGIGVKSSRAQAGPSAANILNILISEKLVSQFNNNRLAFSSPWLAGYFASCTIDQNPQAETPDTSWSLAAAKAQFALQEGQAAWLDELVQVESSTMQANLCRAASWLRLLPADNPNRAVVMRSIVPQIQSEDLPFAERIELLAHITGSNDPAVLLLFKQWLSVKSSRLRQLAILGLAVNQDIKSINDIAGALSDPALDLRYAACYALSLIDTPAAQTTLREALLTDDEKIKMCAAEALAASGSRGQDILKELTKTDDLLVRRAVVYGLSQISEPWVAALLEKIALEDSQWVVRNAAEQALENIHNPNPFLPAPTSIPSEAPWLIQFAARQGLGVSRQDSPLPLILQALKMGNTDEKIQALWMARKYLDPLLRAEIEELQYHEQFDLRETARYVLWQTQSAT